LIILGKQLVRAKSNLHIFILFFKLIFVAFSRIFKQDITFYCAVCFAEENNFELFIEFYHIYQLLTVSDIQFQNRCFLFLGDLFSGNVVSREID